MAPRERTKTEERETQAGLRDDSLLQAVLLVDTYGIEKSWGPLIKQDDDYDECLPWCLLPLLGRPILQWTLDSLALGGVQQIFLFAREGVEEIKEYLSKETTLLEPDSFMPVTIISTTAFSQGDVLREVDSRAILKTKTGSGSDIGTFVLVQCGYIGNLELSLASWKFTASRKSSGGLLCLSEITESKPDRASSSNSTLIHLLDQDYRVLYFQANQQKFPSTKYARIPTEFFQQSRECLLRADLESVGVDICSVEVPQLFTENFDYQQIRPDFVHGILTSELLGKTIRCEVVKESSCFGSGVNWATLVGDVKSYDYASKNILARRSQPLVLEQARLGKPSLFSQRHGMVYIADDVDLAKECTIESMVCLSKGCVVSHRATVSQSYIGSSTLIGDFSQIDCSYLFDKVLIGSNSRILQSIIGTDVVIKSNCIIEEGCLIGSGVVVEEGTDLRAVNVSLEGPEGSYKLPGARSKGVVWPRIEGSIRRSVSLGSGEDSDSNAEDERIDIRNHKFSRLGTSHKNPSFCSLASSALSLSSVPSVASSSPSTNIQDISSIGEVGSTTDFLMECIRSLERAFKEDHTLENASIELKTLRMASNVSQSRFRSVVLGRVCKLVHSEPSKLKKWGSLIKNLLGNDENLEDMEEVLLDLQRWSCENLKEDRLKFFSKILQYFYNEDVVTEEGIARWFKSSQSKVICGDEGLKLREVGGKMLQMLMDADEETDSE
ncbi:hypothetical protein PPACK8108_LOCUS2741 [Phakopsora pachyrhizi]|uniref:Translation initiation factor eIF2B subunit epsilon n=1 Tax=Phakopsora pachyrhizi TaxID=170000 RepID=A0AAV0AJT9_PHAPC|nr:hypothetical protein PPACK8108_LOCUS2741 [Phakopsora pachyrhizi]